MAINKKVSLNWKGEDYDILITMAVIDRIDDKVNIVQLVNQYHTGDIRLTKVARLIECLLVEAGAEVEEGEVFHALFGSGDIDMTAVNPMMTAIFSAIFPEPKKKRTSTKSRKRTRKGKST